jgi:hypothetical protein
LSISALSLDHLVLNPTAIACKFSHSRCIIQNTKIKILILTNDSIQI